MFFRRKKKRQAVPEAAPPPPSLPPPAPVETADDIAETAAWIERTLAQDGGFRFAAGCPPTLLATSFAVCALEVLGRLGDLPEARRAAIADWLQARQDPASGLFRDPQHPDRVICALHKFTPLYIEWQETYFALHALDALGREPGHPLAFIEPFADARVLDAWLRVLRFDDFWFVSNYLMFLLLFALRAEGDASPTAHRTLDFLDARQDPETGFWGTNHGASLFAGMAGAFHVYGFYQYLGRPIAHQAQAVRQTLALQEETGLWSDPGGGPCEDLDAVDILVKLEADPADEAAVRAALRRAQVGMRACRQPGGGYVWSSPQPGVGRRRVHYSGLDTLQVDNDAGDVWSAWFRPLALALAGVRLGEPVAWTPTYRRFPLLGWHPDP